MTRKHLTVSVIAVAAVLAVMAVTALSQQSAQASPEAQGIVPSPYYWSYAAKFVCGYQKPLPAQAGAVLGEPPVKPGNYATEINIHNPFYRLPLDDTQQPPAPVLPIYKKLVILVKDGEPIGREPKVVSPFPLPGPDGQTHVFETIKLPPDGATMDDCNAIWRMMGQQMGAEPPLTIGFLVVISPLELDVDAVYTAEAMDPARATEVLTPTGISIDVNRVTGKRILMPANVLPHSAPMVFPDQKEPQP
ncbi:MAG: hypothetical protein U0768_09140 [Anaerolineae bacterium]